MRLPAVALLALLAVPLAGCRNAMVGLLSAGPVTAQTLWQDARQAHTGGQRVRSVSFHSDVAYAPGAGELLFPESPGGWRGYHVLAPAEGRALLVMQNGGGRRSWAQEDGNLVTLKDGRPYHPRGPATPEHHLRAMRALLMPWDPTDHPAVEVAWLADDNDGNHRVRVQEVDGACDRFDVTVDRSSLLVLALEHRACGGKVPLVVRMEFQDHRPSDNGIITAHRVQVSMGISPLSVPTHDVTLGPVTWLLDPVFPVARPRFP